MTAPAVARTEQHRAWEDCDCDRCRRAQIAWRQRDQLARLAQRRTSSWFDAEDTAQEAIVRALEAPELDCEQLPGWLTRVAINLCTDLARDRGRQHKRIRYQVLQEAAEPDLESIVVERAHAQAMHKLALALPPAQRSALLMRAEGRSVDDVAAALGISPKAAESLLSRARATLRRAAGAVVAAAVLLVRFCRRTTTTLTATAAALSSILVIVPGVVGSAAPGGPIDLPGAAVSNVVSRPVPLAGAWTTRPTAPRPRRVAGHEVAVDAPVLAPQDYRVGPARIHDNGDGRTHRHESLLQSTRECIDDGLVVTGDYVGCAAAQEGHPGSP